MIKSFNGNYPDIAPSASVSDAAYILGEVEIGENSSIWAGTVIRGDFASIRIGNHCLVGARCVIHGGSPVSIDDGAQVGHGVVVHCSHIGSRTRVGMNATLLDDAVIGEECVIAPGSLVSRGMRIPDGSYVSGIPAVIECKVTDAPHIQDPHS